VKKIVQFKELVENELKFFFNFVFCFFNPFLVAMFNNVFLFQAKSKWFLMIWFRF